MSKLMQPVQETRDQDTIISNLPRFNKEFIGIGRTLQQKKRERRQIEDEQRALANRVLFLQKEQQKAQKTYGRKKSEYKQLVSTIDRNEQHKDDKQRLRQLRQMELEAIREQNRQKRLIHKQVSQNAKFSLYLEKKSDHQSVKQLTKSKEKQKCEYLKQLERSKRDHWIGMNMDKEKGKQKIDRFYKKKNTEHTLAYMQMIQKQQDTKKQKSNTIRHLEQFESALKQRLQESTMRVSQMQQKIMKTSRTIEPPQNRPSKRYSVGSNKVAGGSYNVSLPHVNVNRNSASRLSNDEKFEKESRSQLSYLEKSLTDRNTPDLQSPTNNEEEIEEKINHQKQFDLPDSGFKIIRTQRRRKHRNKYKEYIF